MARFKVLEEDTYSGAEGYKIKEVIDDYQNEEGSSHLREKLRVVAAKFIAAVEAAKEFKESSRTPRSTDVRGVRELAKFHAAQQSRASGADQAKLSAKIIKYRQWLTRQGARIIGECTIDWPKTMALSVVYDRDPGLQNFTKVAIRGGLLLTHDNKPLDTSKMVTHRKGPGAAIFVMSAEGNLHVHSHSAGHYHHSSLLAGKPVASAGEIVVRAGRITWLSNKSGHYVPGRKNLLQVLSKLQSSGVLLTFALKVYTSETEYEYDSVGSYLEAEQIDDDSLEKVGGDGY